ncbi:MAG: amidohydrolase [Thermoanaerobaculales bacterium]
MLRLIPLCLALVVVSAGAPSPRRCDRLFLGGLVHTPAGVRRVGIAVGAGRILALVEPDQAEGWRKAATEVVVLGGAHVYPGFTESHGHLTGYGAALEQVDLRATASFDEVIERVRKAARRLPAGAWVVGRGWDQNLWPERSFPTQQKLTAAVPERPALLRRVDGHAVLLNARALTVAGITAATPDPPGGRILRDGSGAPTGVLVDDAVELVEKVVPPPTAADIKRRVLLAARRLAEFGITEIHDPGTSRAELAVLRKLQHDKRLPVRVYVMLDGGDDTLLATELPHGPWRSEDGMLTVRAVKLYADGALGSRGAWLSAPYHDDPTTRGLEVTPVERLREVVRRCADAGFQPAIHAIGDAAVTRVLDVYEHELGPRSAALRPRMEHAQVVRPADVPRFAALGVIASVQPTHCTSDMPWAPARLGEDRIAWAYRWRSLLNAGARLCLGSDVPVESPDPRLGMWAAVTRRPPQGTRPTLASPPEVLTFEEALAGYTSWAAFAGFEEDLRGTIAIGLAADLTVLDRDLGAGAPAAILQARVLRAIVAGRDSFVAGSETR